MRGSASTSSALIACALLLAGCEQLGIQDPAKVAAARDAEGKAVGAACRHAGRAIEDCYALNAKAPKASVFAGWKEMNDYMRENKIDTVPPQMAGAKPADTPAEGGEQHADAGKDADKADAGHGAPAKRTSKNAERNARG